MTRQRALRLAREWAQDHKCSLRDGEAAEYHSMFADTLEESMPNEPLTLEQLREMDEPTPVWWKRAGCWCLCERGFIIAPNGNIYEFEETDGTFYRRPPEGETHE